MALLGGNHVIEASESNFDVVVLEQSQRVPVVVDFWAEWCEPCKQLGPVLERLAGEAGGDWILAKVDVDANPRLQQALRIQGIPTVKAFMGGRQVAEFTGAIPEAEVRRFLAQLVAPSEAERLVAEAEQALSQGDIEAAVAACEQALEIQPGHPGARIFLANIRLLERVSQSTGGGPIDPVSLAAELDARLAADPDDVEAAAARSDLDVALGEVEQGLERLVDMVRRLRDDARDAARTHLLSLLETLDPADPRALKARRDLSAALF